MKKYFKTITCTLAEAESKLNEIQDANKTVEVVYVKEADSQLTFLLKIQSNA